LSRAGGWEELPAEGGFDRLVGPLYRRAAPDGWACAFLADERHANRRGVVHGGMLVTFADHALGMNVWHAVGGKPCATVTLSTDFVSAARPGDWVECDCAVTRVANALVFVRGRVHVGERTVLTATGVWKRLGAR
jgi:uncharacterized protein (TIGR00369 family)